MELYIGTQRVIPFINGSKYKLMIYSSSSGPVVIPDASDTYIPQETKIITNLQENINAERLII